MSTLTTTSYRFSSATKARLQTMAQVRGVSQQDLVDELINREYALYEPDIIPSWVVLSGLDGEIEIPTVDERFSSEEKPRRIFEEEEALRVQIKAMQNAEEAWKEATTPEGALDFLEALRKGELSVVGGKIMVPRRAKTSKTFPEIDIESRKWTYDFGRRSHFDSLSMPNDILDACRIEDQTYGIFSIIDDTTGRIIALRERFRISSGREMQITAKFRQKLAKLKRIRIEYHGEYAD